MALLEGLGDPEVIQVDFRMCKPRLRVEEKVVFFFRLIPLSDGNSMMFPACTFSNHFLIVFAIQTLILTGLFRY